MTECERMVVVVVVVTSTYGGLVWRACMEGMYGGLVWRASAAAGVVSSTVYISRHSCLPTGPDTMAMFTDRRL